jgi:hypothetical protein
MKEAIIYLVLIMKKCVSSECLMLMKAATRPFLRIWVRLALQKLDKSYKLVRRR